MVDHPNKPGTDASTRSGVRDVEERQAVKNQSVVSPDDYPEPASGADSVGGKGIPKK